MKTDSSLLRLGTSSWSCSDWVGKFYESGTDPKDFIASYARKLSTVEIDSTFYAIPRQSTVEGWRDRTPETFIFAAKAPQLITHEKFLADCGAELNAFLEVLSVLGPRLGPILFQFPYYSKASGVTREEFLRRLGSFLPSLPGGYQWAVEVRNKTWIGRPLLDLLGESEVTLALIDHPWMSRPDSLFAMKGILTGPFAYIRWLGDRHGIEKMTTTWNETVVDRRSDLECWVPHLKELLEQRLPVFGYVNNHYAGFAPGTLELLQELFEKG
jgi:uncharacterized protein YecE (DUF72 family)